METKDIRRKNMCGLIESRAGGNKREFADQTGMAYGYVSQVANEERNLGDKVAMRIEKRFGLPAGWMDTPKLVYDLRDPDEALKRGTEILAAMEPEVRQRAVKILAALAEPASGNGENGEPGSGDGETDITPRKKNR